jgi:tetratricopeptide (TPR) repeat protein
MKSHLNKIAKCFFVLLNLSSFSLIGITTSTCNVITQQSAHPKDSLKADRFYQSGLKSYKSKNYDSAMIYLSQAIELDKTNALYYSYRGSTKRRLGKYTDALNDINKGIEIDKKNARLYYEKGLIEKSLDNYLEALSAFNSAIFIDPSDSYSLYEKAYCNRMLSNYEDALKDITYLINKEPNFIGFYLQKGLILYELKDYSATIAAFNHFLKAGQIDSDGLKTILYERGVSYYNVKKYDSAAVDLEKVTSMKPEATAYRYLGMVYDKKKDSLKSIQNFKNSLKLDSTNYYTYYYYAVAAFNFGNCAKASELMHKSEQFSNKETELYSTYYITRASIKACLNDTIGALKDFELAKQLDSTNYDIYISRISFLGFKIIHHPSVSYMSNGGDQYTSLVISDLKKLTKKILDKKQLFFIYTLEGIYTIIYGDSIQSELSYKKAIELAPDSATKSYGYYNLAASYIFFRNDTSIYIETIDLLNKCIKLNKSCVNAYELLGMTYAGGLNDIKKGCEVLKEAENQFKDNKQIRELKKACCKDKYIALDNIKLDVFKLPPGNIILKVESLPNGALGK